MSQVSECICECVGFFVAMCLHVTMFVFCGCVSVCVCMFVSVCLCVPTRKQGLMCVF